MALYLKENFKSYQTVGMNGSRKTLFLRKMKDALQFQCSDKQLVNGFDSILRKYKLAKDKLNATGFGIDPEKDNSIKEGFLKNFCPYFDTLDEVMGKRPNISPPFILESDTESEVDYFSDPSSPTLTLVTDSDSLDESNVTATINAKQTSSPEVISMVRKSFAGIGVKRPSTEKNKSPVAAFIEVLSDKITSGNTVDLKRVDLEREKFDYAKQQEMEKVHALKEGREYEVKKMKMQQEFELEKLKLQIELEKLRSVNKNSST